MDLTLSNISINQILVFLTVAETKGFLKASLELNLSQSAVSKSVAKLEKDLGLPLFRRTTRQLELTKEGEQLFEAWKPMIISIQTAYKHVLNNRSEESAILKIGLVSTVAPEKYFLQIQEKMQEAHPAIQIQVFVDSMSVLEEMLAEGKIHIAFVPDFEHYTLDNLGISWIWSQKKTARLIVSSSHPLADKDSVSIEDILSENYVTLQDLNQDNYEKDLRERFSDYNAVPNIVMPYHSAYALKSLFHPKDEVLFVDQFFDYAVDDIVRIPISDQWNGIICAWNALGNASVDLFMDIVRKNAVIEE